MLSFKEKSMASMESSRSDWRSMWFW